MNNIIDLAAAHVTQYSDTKGKSKWHVRQNITSKDLFELPGELTEAQVFKIMNFARKFELIAFNAGITFGKQKIKDIYDPVIAQLRANLELAKQENERLADILQKHIKSEE